MSRRTDVPAFYGEWFERRLQAGFAGWRNVFGGRKQLVSLLPQHVSAFVFWSKNYRPFLPVLERVRAAGYPAVFHYTITGLPRELESDVVDPEDAIASLRELARGFSPDHIHWRYDPVVLSSRTDEAWHLRRFAWLAARLEGLVKRCVFSFPVWYGKVARGFRGLEREGRVRIDEPDARRRLALATRLAEIAAGHGIAMFSCCGESLLGGRIAGAHCIDSGLLARLYPGLPAERRRPTRPGCGCTASVDIGAYDTCPHGCVYCYANRDKARAAQRHREHEPDAAFLGVPRAEAERWVEELRQEEARREQARAERQLDLGL